MSVMIPVHCPEPNCAPIPNSPPVSNRVFSPYSARGRASLPSYVASTSETRKSPAPCACWLRLNAPRRRSSSSSAQRCAPVRRPPPRALVSNRALLLERTKIQGQGSSIAEVSASRLWSASSAEPAVSGGYPCRPRFLVPSLQALRHGTVRFHDWDNRVRLHSALGYACPWAKLLEAATSRNAARRFFWSTTI